MTLPYRRLGLSVLLGLSLVGLVPAVAFGGIGLACGDTLTSNTTLSADLDCSAYNGTALYMGANGITLDLNGHTIWGWTGADDHSGVDTNGRNKTVITDGTIANFGYGVYLSSSSQSVVSWLDIVGEVADTDDYGIYGYYGAGNRINRVDISGVDYGVYLEYGSDTRVSNSMIEVDGYGVYTYYQSRTKLFDNTVTPTAGFQDNVYGFYDEYSGNNRYVGNTANGVDTGFYLYCDEYGRVRLEGNTANGNYDTGFYLYYCHPYVSGWAPGTGSVVTGNTANDNAYYGFYDYYSQNATWSHNRAHNNGIFGFVFQATGGHDITDNRARGNDDSGFRLYENYSSGYQNVKRFSWNRANGNDSYGFYADYGTPGKGNRAKNNGSWDCYNVRCV